MPGLTDATASQASSLLDAAKTMVGKPYYQGGGDDSDPSSGFDCSGLVWYSISQIAKLKFSYSVTSNFAINPMVRRLKIPPDVLLAGDMMLFQGHVGFYDPNPPTKGKTLFSATSHGVRYEDPKFWGTPLGYFRLQVAGK